MPNTALPLGKFGLHLTSVTLSECKSVDNRFVRALTEVTGSNLRKLDISFTSADCFSLLYLAGFTLAKVLELKNLTGIDEDDTLLQQQPTCSSHQECEEEVIPVEENSLITGVCDICLGVQGGGKTPENDPRDDDFEVIEYMVPRKSENEHDDWEIFSMVDETEIAPCRCTATTGQQEIFEDFKQQQQQIKLHAETTEQLFKPNLVWVDIADMDISHNVLSKKCFEVFLKSNKRLEHLFVSWNNLDVDTLNLDCIVQNDIHLKSFHFVKTMVVVGINWDSFVNYSQSLVDLDLYGASFMSDASIIQLVRMNLNIKKLGLSQSSISDQVVLVIADVLCEKVGFEVFQISIKYQS